MSGSPEITRRSFLAFLGAAFLTPTFAEKVVKHVAQTGEPLLLKPDISEIKLYALCYDTVPNVGSVYDLRLDTPNISEDDDFFSMTWREYIRKEHGALTEDEQIRILLEEHLNWGYDPDDEDHLDNVEYAREQLSEPADEFLVDEAFRSAGSTKARAHALLVSLDLGPDLESGEGIGRIDIYNSGFLGSMTPGVDVYGQASLSFLQARLLELGHKVEIEVIDYEEGMN